jgi:hypothetical protein
MLGVEGNELCWVLVKDFHIIGCSFQSFIFRILSYLEKRHVRCLCGHVPTVCLIHQAFLLVVSYQPTENITMPQQLTRLTADLQSPNPSPRNSPHAVAIASGRASRCIKSIVPVIIARIAVNVTKIHVTATCDRRHLSHRF